MINLEPHIILMYRRKMAKKLICSPALRMKRTSHRNGRSKQRVQPWGRNAQLGTGKDLKDQHR